MLPPLLFTLYRADFQYRSHLCHLQKFSDGQEEEYRDLVNNLMEWCGKNLLLNVLMSFVVLVERRTLNNLADILDNKQHPFHDSMPF